MKSYCLIPVLAFLTATLFSFPALAKTVSKFKGFWAVPRVVICETPATFVLKINAQGAIESRVSELKGHRNVEYSSTYGHVLNNGTLKIKIPTAPEAPAVVVNGSVSLYKHGKFMHFKAMVLCEKNHPKFPLVVSLEKLCMANCKKPA